MKRHLKLVFSILSLIFVGFVFAAITVRIALHVGEIDVPDLSGMTVHEASTAAIARNLDLAIDNRFYSTTVPAGRILTQSPKPGEIVRRGWQVRVTESLGPQIVAIPNVVGEPIRQATMDMRRQSLDLGTIARIEAPGDPDMVLAQTPQPGAGVDQKRIHLLVADTADTLATSFVLPSFVGMSYAQANHAAISLGLRVATIGGTSVPQAPQPSAPISGTTLDAATPATATSAPTPTATSFGPVAAQSPAAGFRANKNDVVRLIFGHSSAQ
jgi:beta-lactam-binding protein with PASTA domain